MSKEITERIKESVNQWLQKLKEKHPELHLTSQWKRFFLRDINQETMQFQS